MGEDLINITQQNFEDIKHIDENGVEFWYARELQLILDYIEWRKFEQVIKKAKETCRKSAINVSENFTYLCKTIKRASGVEKKIKDIKLTRYACYLIIQNGDSRKKKIALAQTYMIFQTRKRQIKENIGYREDLLGNEINELAINLFKMSFMQQK